MINYHRCQTWSSKDVHLNKTRPNSIKTSWEVADKYFTVGKVYFHRPQKMIDVG